MRQPRLAPRSPPRKFLANFSATAFRKVQLILRSCGGRVGSAERNAARSSAWQALHLSLIFSRLAGFKNRKVFISYDEYILILGLQART